MEPGWARWEPGDAAAPQGGAGLTLIVCIAMVLARWCGGPGLGVGAGGRAVARGAGVGGLALGQESVVMGAGCASAGAGPVPGGAPEAGGQKAGIGPGDGQSPLIGAVGGGQHMAAAGRG